MTVKDLLKGTTPGNLQTVGSMQVIPLLSDIEFENFVSPNQAGSFKTTSYGSMSFTNDSDKTLIVPSNITYLTKQSAQDHAMSHAGILKAKTSKTYDTACCVQQTQGGYITNDKHDFVIMPFTLRQAAMELRKEKAYNKLWPAIVKFNQRLGVKSTSGHLEYFFTHFNKELEEFVAQFETVPKQVGAIVLINGVVVGIEKAPNYDYWKSVWSSLLRGCYGSLALENDRTSIITKKSVEKMRTALDLTKINSLEDLEAVLIETEKDQKEKVSSMIRQLLDETFEESKEEGESVIRKHIKNKQFIGQIVEENSAAVYVSLVTTEDWVKNSRWFESKEFTI